MGFHDCDVAEKVTTTQRHQHPAQATQHVVKGKVAVAHFADAGGKGDEGANDWDEPTKKNGRLAVLFEKALGPLDVIRLDQPAEFLTLHQVVAEVFPDFKIQRVAGDGGDAEQADQQPDVETLIVEGGQRATQEQQGVPRQEGRITTPVSIKIRPKSPM